MSGVKEDGPRFAPAGRARAKLFTHGGSQAVRLPKAFRFEGEEVLIHRDGERVILEAVGARPPTTPAERAAFWAEIDRLRGDQLLEPAPRDETFFRPDPDEAL